MYFGFVSNATESPSVNCAWNKWEAESVDQNFSCETLSWAVFSCRVFFFCLFIIVIIIIIFKVEMRSGAVSGVESSEG